jgi:predicted alpha/beta superfamily hydrolase
MNMQKNVLLVITLMILLSITRVEASSNKHYAMPRTEVIPLKESKTGRQYELYVKLPENYATEKNISYPVIYFTDAVWHIELLSAATEYLMPNAILVGISWQKDINADLVKEKGEHVSRFRDYSVTPSKKPEKQAKYQFGQASNHLQFIRNDVINTIENKYRTIPENRTYFGYSLGGVFGAYVLMAQPDTFSNYILGSPSLWRDIPQLKSVAENNNNINANVFITNGEREKELSVHVNTFVSLLTKRNDKESTINRQVIAGDHQTAFPSTGISGITWLSSLTKGEQ